MFRCVAFLALAVSIPLSAAAQTAPLARLSAGSQTCRGVDGYAAAFGGRRTFFLKPGELTAIKASLATDPTLKAAYAVLIRRADAALTHRPGSVMDKTVLPPSSDRHDYRSIAPYWWPDPAKPDGLPYVRRDGEINPQRDTSAFDRTAIGRMSDDMTTLSLAYFYSGDRRYAVKAATLVRTWFLDPATAMNPNARFAQGVPGREDGRAEGVLDTSAFQPVIDAIGLIAPSHVLTRDEGRRLEQWFGRYIDWMMTSPTGRAEDAATNNHGIWFDDQLAYYALFARRPEIARAVVEAFPAKRIAVQFDPSGKLPAELTRTRSLHYSIYALTPAFDVAEIAGCLGYDLWNYRDAAGRGLRSATDFLAAYRGNVAAWPYKEIRPEPDEVDALLTRANWAWGRATYPHNAPPPALALQYRAQPRSNSR
ncbi:alginate lyase family protein [Sphingomonas panacisoli]|uniref:Alginate lyase family protein n=1 Tax=Sphingomonas panacisoli TaxID=1813879 RepID=A0A5B8LLF7_9SPHN|nr:alginate lyase family protein [Sphingomonas panacisoli]QDZ07890.1 alginate lyase family protein [Sphingomonas panacisoli]